MSFSNYKQDGAKWITFVSGEFCPDYLELAKSAYQVPMRRFGTLLAEAPDAESLLRLISEEPRALRIQLLRIFRKYVSPDTSVEMLKRKTKIPEIIREFGDRFRSIETVRANFSARPLPDESLSAILYEYKDRGKKGYVLTSLFFDWFRSTFEGIFQISGPKGAGKDIALADVLGGYTRNIPVDFAITDTQGQTLAIGFARYDSDRGGAQEDDRIKGYRDNITEILGHAPGMKIVFLNDGPGLLLGSMWDDYARLEQKGAGRVIVVTLKMLEGRLTKQWLES